MRERESNGLLQIASSGYNVRHNYVVVQLYLTCQTVWATGVARVRLKLDKFIAYKNPYFSDNSFYSSFCLLINRKAALLQLVKYVNIFRSRTSAQMLMSGF